MSDFPSAAGDLELLARLRLAKALAAEGPTLMAMALESLTRLNLPAEIGWLAFRGLGGECVARFVVILCAVELGALTRSGLLAAITDPDLVVVEELERLVRRHDERRRRLAETPLAMVPASAGEVRDLLGRLFGARGQ